AAVAATGPAKTPATSNSRAPSIAYSHVSSSAAARPLDGLRRPIIREALKNRKRFDALAGGAPAVDRRVGVGVPKRHAAEYEIIRREPQKRWHRLVPVGPGLLRAGV